MIRELTCWYHEPQASASFRPTANRSYCSKTKRTLFRHQTASILALSFSSFFCQNKSLNGAGQCAALIPSTRARSETTSSLYFCNDEQHNRDAPECLFTSEPWSWTSDPCGSHQISGSEVRCHRFRGSSEPSVPVDLEGYLTEGSSVQGCVLTPVIQTSHNISLQHFIDSSRPCVTFDQSQDRTKTAAAAWGGFSWSLIALGGVERNIVVVICH